MSPHESSPRRERELRIWVLENEQGKVNDQMLEEDEALRIVIFASEAEQRFWRETGSLPQEHEERPQTHEENGDSDVNECGSDYSSSYYTDSLESRSDGSLTDDSPKKPEQGDRNVTHRGGWGGRDLTRRLSSYSSSSVSESQLPEPQQRPSFSCGGVRSPRNTHFPREPRPARHTLSPTRIVNVCKFDELLPREQLHIVTTAMDLGYPWHFSFEVPEDDWPFMFLGRSNPISWGFPIAFAEYGNGEELKMINKQEQQGVSGGVRDLEQKKKEKKEKKGRSQRRRGRK